MKAHLIIAVMADEIKASGNALADHNGLILHLHRLRQFTASEIDKHFDAALKRAMGTNRARRAA